MTSTTDLLPEGFDDFTDPWLLEKGIPHEAFRRARQTSRMHWVEQQPGAADGMSHVAGHGYWAVTRHEDVAAISKNSKDWSTEENGSIIRFSEGMTREQVELQRVILLNQDPPHHTQHRSIISRGFTPRSVNELEQLMTKRAHDIVAAAVAEGGGNFVDQVAAELPLQAIADLIGVPQEDRHKLFDWSNRMIGVDDPAYNGDPADGSAAAAELYIYANTLGAEKRAVPTDDIVSRLVNAEVDGDQLTDAEFDMFFLLLTVAGNETTRNATSLGVRALMEHPDQYAALQADRDLLGTAIEEMLRWATPVHHFRRIATTDTELGGQAIAAGDKVVIWHASANRDEAVFDEPHRFDVRRDPNEHVAFGGGGPHFCLGANLARMELRLIFTEILDRMPDLEPVGTPEVLRSNFIHGITSMPVRFTPTPASTSVGV